MKKVSNKSLLFTSLTAAALLLGACGTDDSDTGEETATGGGEEDLKGETWLLLNYQMLYL